MTNMKDVKDKATVLNDAYDLIEALYNLGKADWMYEAMGQTGGSVQECLIYLRKAIDVEGMQ